MNLIDVRHTIEIQRPAEEVFAFLADPANNTRWQNGVTESGAATPGPIGVGTRVKVVREFMGKAITTVFNTVEFNPGRGFAFKTESGPVALEGSIEVEPAGDGCRVTFTGGGDPGRGMFALAGPFIAKIVRNQTIGDAETLKRLMESRNQAGG